MSIQRVHFSTPLETSKDNMASDGASLEWDNTIKELAAMFDQEWARRQPSISRRSATTESVDEEEEVDELMDEDSPSYDLGWNALLTRDTASAGKFFVYFNLMVH
ncbi:hypothetical protein BDR05DRAFT_1000135 [Suillus weaverae]|nr:hypothetical protein BDR05DRAFT_1000135 [Suillus weaverae]